MIYTVIMIATLEILQYWAEILHTVFIQFLNSTYLLFTSLKHSLKIYVIGLGKPPVTHKDKYWEICNSIIQNVISWEGLKLQVCSLLWIYSCLIAIRLTTPQCTASWISCHFRSFFINTTSSVEGEEWWVLVYICNLIDSVANDWNKSTAYRLCNYTVMMFSNARASTIR